VAMIRLRTGRWVAACLVALLAGACADAQTDQNVGKPMPRLKLGAWFSPEKVTQDDLFGRPYVVEFWATWCPPCRTTTPHLVKLASKYKSRGLMIIGLSLDKPGQEAKVKQFYAQYKMNYPVALDQGTAQELNFRGIPFAVVVDQAGLIAWAGHPMGPKFEEAIKLALDEWVIKLADFPNLGELATAILRKGGKEPISRLKALADDPSRAKEAKRLLRAVGELAQMQLGAARKRAAVMPTEGVTRLDAVAAKFEGMEQGSAAAEEANKIRSAPSFADEVAVVQGMEEVEASMQHELQGRLKGIGGRKAQIEAALPIFRGAVGQLKALVKKHGKARSAEVVRKKIVTLEALIKRLEG